MSSNNNTTGTTKKKRLILSASIQTDSTSYYHRVENHKTGRARVVISNGPVSGLSRIDMEMRPFRFTTERGATDGRVVAYERWSREAIGGMGEEKGKKKKDGGGEEEEEEAEEEDVSGSDSGDDEEGEEREGRGESKDGTTDSAEKDGQNLKKAKKKTAMTATMTAEDKEDERKYGRWVVGKSASAFEPSERHRERRITMRKGQVYDTSGLYA